MSLTICLLNWRRPENLRRIIERLAAQTVRPRLFLWNNAPEPFRHPDVEWTVESARNIGCAPRWWMAALAATEFVAAMDDDLMPGDGRVLEDALRVAAAQPPDCAVGPFGAVFRPGRPYAGHEAVGCPACDRAVDLVKGRFLIVRTDALRTATTLGDLSFDRRRLAALEVRPAASTPPRIGDAPEGAFFEDDIAVCGALAAGRRRHHLVSDVFHGRIVSLSEGDGALRSRPDHFFRREAARRRWFENACGSDA